MAKFTVGKTKKAKEKKIEQLGSVSIHIGKEEKEVQNLHLRTTVNEVISALIKDENDDAFCDLRHWVIVESWRGIERPLPPKTRLLKVWNSWKNEQRFVKFYLKKSSSISFRHNQPSKSLRNRRKRPNFIGAQETFIDGPTGLCQFNHEETSAATSESTSGTTTSGDTFGSPSELSLTTTTTTTTTTESNESDSDQHCNRSTKQDHRLRQLISQCVEDAERIEQMNKMEMALKYDIEILDNELRQETMRSEFDELNDQINLVEERISSLNNVSAGIQMNIFHEKQRCVKFATPEEEEKARAIQTKIEAHLYVNLQLAAESDLLAEELEYLEHSFSARMALLDPEINLNESREIEDQILIYVSSQQETYCGKSDCRACPDCIVPPSSSEIEIRQRKTSSTTTTSTTSTTSGNCSASSFENNFDSEKGKNVHFDSDSSLPDSDSAVSSISSSEFERLNRVGNNIVKNVDNYVRETLV